MLFGEIMIILFENSNLVVVKNIVTNLNIGKVVLEFNPLFVIHPPTYLNKLLLAGETEICLYNTNTSNKIFSLHEQESVEAHLRGVKIVNLTCSPAVDVVCICLSDGKIILVNLKTAVILKVFR